MNIFEKRGFSVVRINYHFSNAGKQFPAQQRVIRKATLMKLVVRIFALSVVIAGAAAASMSSSSTHATRSRLSATETLPVPTCGPRMPGCSGNTQ